MPLLQIENLCIRLGGHPIVRDACITVNTGEFVAILGPSGCGKTTTLRGICGLELPDSGSILYEGQDITRVPTHQRNIGYLFQEGALFPHLTVEQNICFGIRDQSKGIQNERVAHLLDLVQLTGLGSRSTTALSGGQRQRVALARALARQPKLMLLDEPFSSLDETLKETLRNDLFEILKQTNTAAIMVTHNEGDARSIAARTVWMSEGCVRPD